MRWLRWWGGGLPRWQGSCTASLPPFQHPENSTPSSRATATVTLEECPREGRPPLCFPSLVRFLVPTPPPAQSSFPKEIQHSLYARPCASSPEWFLKTPGVSCACRGKVWPGSSPRLSMETENHQDGGRTQPLGLGAEPTSTHNSTSPPPHHTLPSPAAREKWSLG